MQIDQNQYINLESYVIEGLKELDNINYDLQDYISLEGMLSEGVKKLGNLLITIIDKIKEWFKKFWTKINLYMTYYFRYFTTIGDEFRYIRNKNNIMLSKESIKIINNIYPNLNLKNLKEDVMIVLDLPFKLLNIIENVLNDKSFNKTLIFIDHSHKGYIDISNGNINYIEEYINTEEKVFNSEELDFYMCLEVADILDKRKFGLKEFYSKIENIQNKIKTNISKLEENMLKSKNLLLLERNYITKVLSNYIYNIKRIQKILRVIYKDACRTTSLGYYKFIKKCQEDKTFYTKSGYDKMFGNPHSLKIVDDGKYLFIDFNKNEAKSLIEDGEIAFTKTSTVTELDITSGVVIDMDNQVKSFDSKDNILEFNLIFICSKIVRSGYLTPLNETIRLNFDFVYWHEVGHIVTGQNEFDYNFTTGGMYDPLINQVEAYIKSDLENKSDAYAMLMTGLSLDQVWEERIKYFNVVVENMKNKISLNNKDSIKEFKRWKETIKSRKEEYKTNVYKHIDEMRRYSKLGFKGWLNYYKLKSKVNAFPKFPNEKESTVFAIMWGLQSKYDYLIKDIFRLQKELKIKEIINPEHIINMDDFKELDIRIREVTNDKISVEELIKLLEE